MDTFIDPTTAAYKATSEGLARDPAGGLANAIYLRLMTPLGSYWAAPLMGSRLHELQRAKAVSNVGLIAKQYAEQALAELVADGRARSLEVEVNVQSMADASKSMAMQITVVDATGQRHTFPHVVRVA